MMKLISLKKRYNWSLLIIAHTPKRNMSNPIIQNDLAGSKKLYNFFDSVIAIGQSARDPGIKYVKQVKVRAGEYKYGADNGITYEIVGEGAMSTLHSATSPARKTISRNRKNQKSHRSRSTSSRSRKRARPSAKLPPN